MIEILRYIWEMIISITESLVMVSKLIFQLCKDMPLFIKLTTAFSADLPKYLNWLPASVVSIITLTIGIVVVYKFFGRT